MAGKASEAPSVSYFHPSCERLLAGRASEAPYVFYFYLSCERLLAGRASLSSTSPGYPVIFPVFPFNLSGFLCWAI